nr:hypothetical protein [Tanacetum cinerariifolium]
MHEGRVVFDNFTDLNYVRSSFHFVEFECLLEINEQVCPRFILEFYSQYRLSYSDEDGHLMSWYMVPLQKAHIKPTSLLPMISSYIFEKIEKVKSLASVIKKKLRENLEGIVARQEVFISFPPPPSINHLHLISTMMMEIMKGPRVQVLLLPFVDYSLLDPAKPSAFCYTTFGIHKPNSHAFLLSYYALKLNKPYFLLILSSSSNNYTMSSSNASSTNPSKKIKLTIIPHRQLFVNISSEEDVTTTPSPTTTSSSPTPLNAPSKTISTNQTSSCHENTSTSFQSKLQISPPSLNEPTSPHPLNPFLNTISDVPPRPINPQPHQSHPSLDITLSLSPITPLDHIHDTPSPPSPPKPQSPIMGHPLYYNYNDYHRELVDIVKSRVGYSRSRVGRRVKSRVGYSGSGVGRRGTCKLFNPPSSFHKLLLIEDMLETLVVGVYDAIRPIQVVSLDLKSKYNCTQFQIIGGVILFMDL